MYFRDTILENNDSTNKDSNFKVMLDYQSECGKELTQIFGVKDVKLDDYKGFSLIISFEDEYTDKLGKKIKKTLENVADAYKNKYNTKFYWNLKVGGKNSCLIVLDSDYKYDNK